MMPPMLMKVSIYEEGAKKMNFWIPLVRHQGNDYRNEK